MEAQLTNTDIDLYLTQRANKGFNAFIMQVIEHHFADHAPNNIDNIPPFTGATFSTPNPAYFNRIDYILQQASTNGMCAFLYPLYLGNPTSSGWLTEIVAATDADMQSWADFLATRYGNSTYQNIVWVIGGNLNPSTNATAQHRLDIFATCLAASDSTHLITAQNARGTMGIAEWPTATWITLNTVYTQTNNLAADTNTAYAVASTTPVIMIESIYEGEHTIGRQQLRGQAYQAILGGACGQFFGNNPMWYFSSTTGAGTGDGTTDPDWHNNFNTNGANGMAVLKELFAPRRWYDLIPDTAHTFVTAGYGTIGGTDYVSSSITADGQLGVIYVQGANSLTVDMRRFPTTVHARWYDPSNGDYTEEAPTFPNTGFQTLVSPGTNVGGGSDWVLLLEANVSLANLLSTSDLQSELHLMTSTGTNDLNLTAGKTELSHISNDQPEWHPNGNTILFQSVNPSLTIPGITDPPQLVQLVQGGFGYNNDLWVMDAERCCPTRIFQVKDGEATHACPLYPAFSPTLLVPSNALP
jgi:hypothetical protein